MSKKLPILKSDEEAEQFLESTDLSEYDLSEMKPVKFEYQKKSANLNMRLPKALLEAIKAKAAARGLPYQRYIRELLEQAVSQP